MSALREVGKRRPQAGIEERVRGGAVYTHDVTLPGMLYGAILRSPHAHARIASIDVSEASALPGVHAIIVGEDFKETGDGLRYLLQYVSERGLSSIDLPMWVPTDSHRKLQAATRQVDDFLYGVIRERRRCCSPSLPPATRASRGKHLVP